MRRTKKIAQLAKMVHPKQVIRVSSLTGCQRKQWYTAHDYVQDEDTRTLAEKAWAMMRGTLMHKGLESYTPASPSSVTEHRLWQRVGRKYVVTGKPDLIEILDDQFKLWDYKTTGLLPVSEPYSNHVAQIRLYAWLMREWGYAKLPIHGIVMYHSLADGLKAFDWEVEPYTTGEVLTLLSAVHGTDILEHSPIAPWECKSCPFSACDWQHTGDPAVEEKRVQALVDKFGFDAPEEG